MPAPGERCVVLTGAHGPVATALERTLAARGWAVVALRRGDDLLHALDHSRPSAIVVMDAVGGAAAHVMALRAVAEALSSGRAVDRVVALAPVPPARRARKKALERYAGAEADARDAGVPLTA